MSLRIAIVQKIFKVEDLEHNLRTILDSIRDASEQGAELIVFPEMALTSYPPEDLLFRTDYLDAVEQKLAQIADSIPAGVEVVLGAPTRQDGVLFNTAVHMTSASTQYYYKRALPNYGVFDEKRYFAAGQSYYVWEIKGYRLALTICEDIWDAAIVEDNKAHGAQCIINISASPFEVGKYLRRLKVVQQACHDAQLPMLYVNALGAEDELVFDGTSFAADSEGAIALYAQTFTEGIYFHDPFSTEPSARHPVAEEVEQIHSALCLALRRYVEKSKARGVAVGVSGGIDSAVVLKIAVDALGADKVRAVLMPSAVTATMSVDDAQQLASNLGVISQQLPITQSLTALQETMESALGEPLKPIALENLQARIRGCLLMGIANQHDLLVVATSNKSEIATGYSTLYGDMVGAYAPLKDVLKTRVYKLARYYNSEQEVIPQRVIGRPPSAELAPDQKDSDVLPPYPQLDQVLKALLEDNASLAELAEQGFAEEIVTQVHKMLSGSEHKRYQGPPGPKITACAFSKDRRYPLAYSLDYEPGKYH